MPGITASAGTSAKYSPAFFFCIGIFLHLGAVLISTEILSAVSTPAIFVVIINGLPGETSAKGVWERNTSVAYGAGATKSFESIAFTVVKLSSLPRNKTPGDT